jgi:hypothetical protein
VITESSGATDTAPVPGNSGTLSISAITGNGFTLEWRKAADAETAEADLQYRVYYSLAVSAAGTLIDNISTYSDALENGTEVTLGWTLDIDTIGVTDLLSGATYNVNVFVRDEEGNISPYTARSDTTLAAGTAPDPGESGALLVSTITGYGFTLEWTKATDADTDQDNLLYRVYYSLNDDISTYTDAQSNGTEATQGWTLDINTFDLSGLSASTLYYANIFVRDEDDMVSAYAGTSTTTGVPAVYLFTAGVYNGGLGGREGADKICRDYYDSVSDLASLPVTNVRAFISIDSDDQIVDFPGNFGIPGGADIMVPTGTVIADSWADLFDGIDIRLNQLLTDITPWWTGSDSDGSVATDTCNGFTDGTSSYDGQIGAHNATDTTWISNGTHQCAGELSLLCVGW